MTHHPKACSQPFLEARQISTEPGVLVRSGSAATTFKYGSAGDTNFLPGVPQSTYHRAVSLHTAPAKIQAYFPMELIPSEASSSCAISPL
jgi:hypothetical protein